MESDDLKDSVVHGYEEEDLNLKLVGLVAGVLLAIVIIVALVIKPLFHYRKHEHHVSTPVARPQGSAFAVKEIFPEPRLLPTPRVELKVFREEESQWLSHYAWVDKKKGIAKVSIDDAIDLLAKRGLPTRAEGSQSP